jgi:hypothetical protein
MTDDSKGDHWNLAGDIGQDRAGCLQLRSSFQLFRRNQRELIRLVDRYDAWVAASYNLLCRRSAIRWREFLFACPKGKKRGKDGCD